MLDIEGVRRFIETGIMRLFQLGARPPVQR
jgi:hypothetical protein